MRKIPVANISFRESFLECISGISRPITRNKYTCEVDNLEAMTNEFMAKAQQGQLYTIPATKKMKSNKIVIGQLTKGDLNKLYSYYMVVKDEGRSIYDSILTASKNICPYCGGIGHASTLDHYLPKSSYPQFSVSPVNLIPSCKDCNVNKKDNIYTDYHQQPFHPFYDNDFASVKWVDAEVLSLSPLSVIFYANPPEDWSEEECMRAINHFSEFDLSKRYSVQAADELETIKNMRAGFMNDLPDESFRDYLRELCDSIPFKNSWKAVLYSCLSNNDDIVSGRMWLER